MLVARGRGELLVVESGAPISPLLDSLGGASRKAYAAHIVTSSSNRAWRGRGRRRARVRLLKNSACGTSRLYQVGRIFGMVLVPRVLPPTVRCGWSPAGMPCQARNRDIKSCPTNCGNCFASLRQVGLIRQLAAAVPQGQSLTTHRCICNSPGTKQAAMSCWRGLGTGGIWIDR